VAPVPVVSRAFLVFPSMRLIVGHRVGRRRRMSRR
jgi:hypothetical protein